MQNLGGVAIHMRQELKSKIRFFVGDEGCLTNIEASSGIHPFSEIIINFLNELSLRLISDSEAKKYSDIITFAFWCRRASITNMKKGYDNLSNRKGRGLSFHIAPSNIPVMFAFSLAASLLAGNSNIIRISSKVFPQTNIICRHINQLLNSAYDELKKRIIIITYFHDEEITKYFSKICDSRIIWGGNNSVKEIRSYPVNPSAIDMPFYDRFSFSIINVDEYLKESNKEAIAESFYNDTYFTDQNACTSPQLLVWWNETRNEGRILEAQNQFWNLLYKHIKGEYRYQDIQAVDKIDAMAKYAIAFGDGKLLYDDMALVRIQIDCLHENLKEFRCPGGYFYEYITDNLNDICSICSKECQTISYFGVSRNLILETLKDCKGVDRIVPIGKTMDFGLQWDGFDFIYYLSKIIA